AGLGELVGEVRRLRVLRYRDHAQTLPVALGHTGARRSRKAVVPSTMSAVAMARASWALPSVIVASACCRIGRFTACFVQAIACRGPVASRFASSRAFGITSVAGTM